MCVIDGNIKSRYVAHSLSIFLNQLPVETTMKLLSIFGVFAVLLAAVTANPAAFKFPSTGGGMACGGMDCPGVRPKALQDIINKQRIIFSKMG